MAVPTGLRRFTAELLAAAAPGTVLASVTVVAVTAGGAADGHSLITVEWNGTEFAAPCLENYSPTVGDVALLGFVNSQPVILGHIIATPPDT